MKEYGSQENINKGARSLIDKLPDDEILANYRRRYFWLDLSDFSLAASKLSLTSQNDKDTKSREINHIFRNMKNKLENNAYLKVKLRQHSFSSPDEKTKEIYDKFIKQLDTTKSQATAIK